MMQAMKMDLRQKDVGCQFLGVAKYFSARLFGYLDFHRTIFFIGTSGWRCSVSHNSLSFSFCENFSFE